MGLLIVIQVSRGLLLVLYFTPSTFTAFERVNYIITEVSLGWFLRIYHINGSSLIFFFLFTHIFKALLLNRSRLIKPWLRGLIILLILIGVGFLGYSLVWSQMRYWAIVVITRLVSVIPYIGGEVLLWVWGGFRVGGGTLKLFFVLHFLLPLGVLLLILIHLFFLHATGRRRKIGYNGEQFKIRFNPLYRVKDTYFVFWLGVGVFLVILFPLALGEPELFREVNTLMSPVHIVPEWYYCRFYGILRSIPNKILGVAAILLALVELAALATSSYHAPVKNSRFFGSLIFYYVFVVLMWLGMATASEPFVRLSALGTLSYFMVLSVISFISNLIV